MGASAVRDGEDILNKARIPTFAYPDTATRVFDYMWEYSDTLRELYETPQSAELDKADLARAEALIAHARATNRTILTEYESKALLAAYGIPTVPTDIATSADAAVAAADTLGYPSRAQAALRNHYAQDRCGRCAAESERRRRCARRVSAH